MLGGILVVLGGTAVGYLNGGRYVGTDDAYVKAAQLTVTTDVSGLVKSVEVHEGQRVSARRCAVPPRRRAVRNRAG